MKINFLAFLLFLMLCAKSLADQSLNSFGSQYIEENAAEIGLTSSELQALDFMKNPSWSILSVRSEVLGQFKHLKSVELTRNGVFINQDLDLAGIVVDYEVAGILATYIDDYQSAISKVQDKFPGWLPTGELQRFYDSIGGKEAFEELSGALDKGVEFSLLRHTKSELRTVASAVPAAVSIAKVTFAKPFKKSFGLIASKKGYSAAQNVKSFLRNLEAGVLNVLPLMKQLANGDAGAADLSNLLQAIRTGIIPYLSKAAVPLGKGAALSKISNANKKLEENLAALEVLAATENTSALSAPILQDAIRITKTKIWSNISQAVSGLSDVYKLSDVLTAMADTSDYFAGVNFRSIFDRMDVKAERIGVINSKMEDLLIVLGKLETKVNQLVGENRQREIEGSSDEDTGQEVVGDNSEATNESKTQLSQDTSATGRFVNRWLGQMSGIISNVAATASQVLWDSDVEANGISNPVDLSPGIHGAGSPITGTVAAQYDHTAWGSWNGNWNVPDPGDDIQQGYFVVGNPTILTDAIPEIGRAEYNGHLVGDHIDGTGVVTPGIMSGDIYIEAKFDSMRLDADLTIRKNNAAWATHSFNNVNIQTPTIPGSTDQALIFNTSESSTQFDASITGMFNGGLAQEVGGSWIYNRPPSSGTPEGAAGVFWAER